MKVRIYVSCLFLISLVFCSGVIWQAPLEEVSAESDHKVVIVVDAGHGGIDGGASAKDGTPEKEITLKIAKELEKVMKDYPVEVIMTRRVDKGLYDESETTIRKKKRQDLQNRRKIMSDEKVDLVVSIHLNSFPEDASVYGAQVFYPAQTNARTDGLFNDNTAASYAQKVQKSLEINISDGKERQAMEKNDILIFEKPACPMILVECGFMSNEKEMKRLKTAEYQGLLASAIWQGINANLCLEKMEKIQVIDSANKL